MKKTWGVFSHLFVSGFAIFNGIKIMCSSPLQVDKLDAMYSTLRSITSGDRASSPGP
jgi:hypothetical protein